MLVQLSQEDKALLSAIGGGGGGSTGGKATAAAPNYVEGATGQPLSLDLKGNLRGIVQGVDAPNAAGTVNPVRIAGSSSPTANNGTVYNWRMTASGEGYVSGLMTNGASSAALQGLMIGGSDGTNYRHLSTDTAGALKITLGANSGSTINLQGNVGSGGTDIGSNPVKVGGRYNSTLPTFTDGQRADLQVTAKGSLVVSAPIDGNGTAAGILASNADAQGNNNGLAVIGRNQVFNGSTWDRIYSAATAKGTAGTGVQAVGALGFDGTNFQAVATNTAGHVLVRDTWRSLPQNETATALGASATFTGTSRDLGTAVGSQSSFAYFNAFVLADQAGTAKIQGSNDNTTWYDATDPAQVLTANKPLFLQVPVTTRYHRVVVVNGATAQGALKVNSSYSAA